jgi:ribosome-binding ATPase YchF (GTP1/OBG family)
MLRAGLIGFPASGKTALFQLLTSAREVPRHGGKTDANVGVARVPDERLDRLTALFNPRKHVPATVEFADIAGVGARTGAQALLDVAPFRNADALLHVVRMFRDPSVPHPAGTIDPARDVRAMEDEVILADLGVVERRLERLQRDLKKGGSADLRKEQETLVECRAALEQGRPLRALQLPADAAKRLRGFQFLSAKPLLLVLNLDEADLAQADAAVRLAGLESFVRSAATRAVPICAKIELEIAQLEAAASSAPATTCSATSRSSPWARTNAARGRFRATRLPSSPPEKSIRTSRAASSARRWYATTTSSPGARSPRAASTASCGSKARTTSSRMATSSTSATRRELRAHRRGAGRPRARRVEDRG